MIVLHPRDYPKVRTLVTAQERVFLPQLLGVLEGTLPGRVVVDDADAPTAAVVFGKSVQVSRWLGYCRNDTFVTELKEFVKREQHTCDPVPVWATAANQRWNEAISTVYGGNLFAAPRTEFEFNAHQYERQRKAVTLPAGVTIRHITASQLDAFVPLRDLNLSVWATVEDYLRGGPGFGAFYGEQWLGYCDSLFVGGGLAELNIGVLQQHRREAGIGTVLAQNYIDACLQVGLVPCWSCDTANRASYRMAQTLGFEPLREYSSYSSLNPADDFAPQRSS